MINHFSKITLGKRIGIIIAVQVSVILLLILSKFLILSGGTSVFLRIEPVDPRDPLRGDYVTFQYTGLSVVGRYKFDFSQNRTFQKGDIVYVPLEKVFGSDYYGLASGSILKNKPEDGLFIKGILDSDSVLSNGNYLYPTNSNIIYGIEEYFIPEGSGQLRDFSLSEIFAKVSIDDNGNAVISQIYIDNKLWP